jgi:hypothetical protein
VGVDSAVSRFRRRERKTWRTTGRLSRAAEAAPTFNEVTGTTTPAEPALIYDGPCHVTASTTSGRRDAQAGEREIRLSSLRAKFPADTDAAVDDVLEVTASTYDAGLVGRSFRITDIVWHAWQVARVAILEEVTR